MITSRVTHHCDGAALRTKSSLECGSPRAPKLLWLLAAADALPGRVVFSPQRPRNITWYTPSGRNSKFVKGQDP